MYFIPCLINVITGLFLISKISKQRINIKNFNTCFIIIITVILYIFNYNYTNYFLVFFNGTILLIIASKFIFNIKICYIITSCILTQIIMFFSEMIITIIIFLIYNFNVSLIIDYFRGTLLLNVSVSIISILFIKNNSISRFLEYLNISIEKYEFRIKIIFSLLFIITLNVLLIILYKDLDYPEFFLINIIFILIYCFILYYALNKNNENVKFKLENEILIANLNEYEKILDYQRINNHENKNQLLVIKSMVEKNNNKTIDYINEIIKEKREDNEVIYTKAKRIPSGGLQGLIYQKMLLMQENNIEVILDVSTQVRKIDLTNISSKMNYDICRIVGIIVDNAIEETIKFDKKDREIIISMYVDDLFFIEVSNRIKENIDINKINEKGYTTKEKGHGYGLNLLNKIVNENDNIDNEIKVVNDIFTQIVKIKM